MKFEAIPRGASLGVLILVPVLVFVAFGDPAQFDLGTRVVLALGPWAVIAAAAWHLGRRGRLAVPVEHARVTAAFLLLAPFASFSLLSGFGPPWETTDRHNVLRFLVLGVDALFVGAGLMVLARSIAAWRGQVTHTLAVEAIRVSTGLYAVFTVAQMSSYRAAARGKSPVDAFYSLDYFSTTLIMMATPLLYLATAALVSALAREGALGRTAASTMRWICLLSAACVAVKLGTAALNDTEPLWTSRNWFTLPGFVLSIPAVPWMIPCALGVAMLWRSGAALEAGTARVGPSVAASDRPGSA